MFTNLGARVAYMAYFVAFAILALVLRVWRPNILEDLDSMDTCKSDSCIAKALVYRVTFSMFTIFMFHSLVMAVLFRFAPTARPTFQRGYWGLKVFLMLAWLVMCMFIPNSFYEVYAKVSIFGAGLFILLQIVLLIEFAYAWNEKWVKKGDEESKSWFTLILVSAAILYILSVLFIVVQYMFFTDGSNCELPTFFITWTIVLGFIFTVLSIMMERGSILSAAVVFFCCCQVTYSANMSNPGDCNSLSGSKESQTWQLALGLGMTVVAVAYKAQKAAAQQDVVMGSHKTDAMDFGDSTSTPDKDKSASDEPEPDDEAYGYSYFHLIFAMGCMYMAMLMTQWGEGLANDRDSEADDNLVQIDKGYTSMWVNIVSCWVTALLYIWSLVAPKLLKNREFD